MACLAVNLFDLKYWSNPVTIKIASSTRSPSERTREKRERKLSVCPASLRTTNVRRNTIGIVSVGTKASLRPIKRKSVPHTKISVMAKSRVSPLRSLRICSERSVVVFTLTSSGMILLAWSSLIFACPASTRSMIDHPDFFMTESVTAVTGSAPLRDRRERVSLFLVASRTSATSRRKMTPGSPMFATAISRSFWTL